MSSFAIRYPFFIIVLCLMVAIVGTVTLARMPVDLFPPINIPVVVVATFYSGMPPQQVETDITDPFERFFTLGSGIDHIESRSLPGVSLIKIYFQPGNRCECRPSARISNLALADLATATPGTLPPVVLKFDASSLPVCLITFKGQGMNETQLRDLGQIQRAQPDRQRARCSVPQPFGGRTGRSWSTSIRETGCPSTRPHGRGSNREQIQSDSAGGRCADRADRLQPLHQQPGAHHSANQ